ncbi:hypothetical protein AB1Y20_019825 [Prymnesium parvum]|uniref:Tyrosine specific protein phosphatases domain-containing protein n=1 Tax=Prymnesium parvum TaxID=97485 RepID=A0AB34JX06_PRYPA
MAAPSATMHKTSYPSTPHLPFSPGVHADDTAWSADACQHLVGQEVVLTEKLDGGNCCLWGGCVYARTHAHEATHPWFTPVKALYSSFAQRVDKDLQLFGENMAAVHSIEYDGLSSCFYLFAVRRATTGLWLAWDEVVALSESLEIPHAPLWWRGTLQEPSQLESMIRRAAAEPSALSTCGGEGFVVRLASSFDDSAFERSMGKYVRPNHIQTGPDFRRNWVKAAIPGSPRQGWRSPLFTGDEVALVEASAPAATCSKRGVGKHSAAKDKRPAAGKGKATRRPSAESGEPVGGWQTQQVDSPRGFRLPALPPATTPFEELRSLFRGPTKRSNWVIPGLVLAGDRSAVDGYASLEGIVRAGVDTFVCLQTKGELVNLPSYEERAREIRRKHLGVGEQADEVVYFRNQPIPDQMVTADELASELVDNLLERLSAGRVLYIHCRGGHGRTGTICSLLLARAYGLSAAEAMARYQWYHDTRIQAIFAAEGYSLTSAGKGETSCVAMFPVQREQVERLIGAGHQLAVVPHPDAQHDSAGGPREAEEVGDEETNQRTAGADAEGGERRSLGEALDSAGVADSNAASEGSSMNEAETLGAATAAPVPPARCLSQRFGHGASVYEEEALLEWEQVGKKAAEAVRGQRWDEAEELTRASIEARPDWHKGYTCLAMVLRRKGNLAGAADALRKGLNACSSARAAAELREALQRLPEEGCLGDAVDAGQQSGADGSGVSSNADAAVCEAKPTGGKSSASARKLPRYVCLVGLPGAGKSTFAQALEKSDSSWVRVSQDEAGSRRVVETQLGRLGKDDSVRIILDRCNTLREDRSYLMQLAMLPKHARTVCVYFKVDAAECEKRVAARTDHPTIRYGGGKAAVKAMAKALSPPTSDENFSEVIVIESFEQSDELLRKWGAAPAQERHVAPAGLYKFPRTHHVLDAGGTGVSRDDLLLEGDDLAVFIGSGSEVIAEEKVDGANLGFSLTEDYRIQAQNRSHFVCSATHSQFKGLDAWLEEHSWALCQILKPNDEILFGEWCFARHSVPYTRLPGYFIAFDIFSKSSRSFCSVDERNRRLDGFDIPIVPMIARGIFNCREDLLALLESRSAYYDGYVEGAYLRVDRGLSNAHRGKIVRPDFIQGITTHWQSHTLVKNSLSQCFSE